MFSKLENKINIVEKFNIFAIIGLICALVGVVSLIIAPFYGNVFNLDIDFAGGTRLTYNMHKQLEDADLEDIKSIVETAGQVKVYSVQRADGGTVVDIKTAVTESQQRDNIFKALKEKYNLNDGVTALADGTVPASDILSSDNVDAVMGADLRNSAIFAALLAVLLMLVYIAIRFDIRSGVAAVTALAHDVFVIVGAYVIFRIPVNMTFIAVILTILGYSINATIVIFDRIRENRKILKNMSFDDIVNKSIWQTATRSLNTSITTLLAIVVIAILGVESIRNFAVPIVIGIIAGLYSSLFISGPIWAKLVKSSKKA